MQVRGNESDQAHGMTATTECLEVRGFETPLLNNCMQGGETLESVRVELPS